jgi:ATPase subunit of ABC transporter with duplicated ATPase domains
MRVVLSSPLAPNRRISLPSLAVNIHDNLGIVGLNSSGKRTVLNAYHEALNTAPHKIKVARVDFASHRSAVLLDTTVVKFLGGFAENQDIIVRFILLLP